jgi:hypothetical protein
VLIPGFLFFNFLRFSFLRSCTSHRSTVHFTTDLRFTRRQLFTLGKEAKGPPFMPTDENKIFLTRKQMVEHLNRHGFPFAESTIDKLCAPMVGRGPKVEAWLGKKPLYSPDGAIEWAKTLLTEKPSKLPA